MKAKRPTMKLTTKRLCVLFLSALTLSAGELLAQAQTSRTVPDHVLYEVFFRNIAAVEHRAEGLERSGRQGASLRKSVCNSIGIDSRDCPVFFAIATTLTKTLQDLDAAARTINDQARRQVKETRALLPPMPPALKQLQEQRDTAVKQSIQAMADRLTPRGNSAIRSFVTSRSQTVTPPNFANPTR